MSELNEEMEHLTQIRNNPGLVIKHAYDILNKVTNGEVNVPNPNNPFSYLLEHSAILQNNLMMSHEIIYRNQYPRLATKYSHLYNHMFDEHYIGRFATPGRCKFEVLFKHDEILQKLVPTDQPGKKKLIIPRKSKIMVNDTVFTLLYDIEITQVSHGALHVLYKINQQDPVQPLGSNQLEWDYVTLNDIRYIRLKPQLMNVSIIEHSDTLNVVNAFKKDYAIKNKFVHCRVYVKRPGEMYEKEIPTTHSELIYDAQVLTARLVYLNDKLRVIIPSVYARNNLAKGTIRVEIYTTLGDYIQMLNKYEPEAFVYEWNKLPNLTEDNRYVVPIEGLSQPIIYAKDILQGGKDGETFEETRDRVVNYATRVTSPITPAQLKQNLVELGYNLIQSRDSITERSYFAVRSMPINREDSFSTGIAASMETMMANLDEIAIHPAARDNHRRVTITPEMVFKTVNGSVKMVYPEDLPSDKLLPADQYVAKINRLEYMVTPFYYVLDTSDNTFDMRAYYLDKPEVYDHRFISNNETTELLVSSNEFLIKPYKDENDEGYVLYVKMRIGEKYKEISRDKLFAQLAVKPHKENNLATINGRLLTVVEDPEQKEDNYIWEFKLKTRWDIDSNNCIHIREMFMRSNEPRTFEIPLEGEFNLVYGVLDQPIVNYIPSSIDQVMFKDILRYNTIMGITHEVVQYRFGHHLKSFWSNAIPVQGEIKYQRYKEDIPRVYSENIYEVDARGMLAVEEGELVLLHEAGDPVLDDKGNPILYARKGDVVIGKNGLPIMVEDRKLMRRLDILMLDGIYRFATYELDKHYLAEVGELLKEYIITDLEAISERLLERTHLYFYPERTMGDAVLIIDGGVEVSEPMRLSFNVTYFMTEQSYNDSNIRSSLINITHDIINEELKQANVSTSKIITRLTEIGGRDIVAVEMDKLGTKNKFTTYTVKDPSTRCSVKRLLTIEPDKTYSVVEDIIVNFEKHEKIPELQR